MRRTIRRRSSSTTIEPTASSRCRGSARRAVSSANPVVLDGTAGGDAGWSPTVQIDATGIAHVAYVDANANNLKYVTDAPSAIPEIIDDGYRIVGTSVDGYPEPVFDFVGQDAGLVLPGGTHNDLVVYQDATTQELLLAQHQTNGTWMHTSIAGGTTPWPGAYGFFASASLHGTDVVMSTWVIDQPTGENWVEVFGHATSIQ